MYLIFAILAGFIFLYTLVAGRLERLPMSGPIVFTSFGVAFGPRGLGVLKLDVTGELLQLLAELSLAVVLFTDAASTNLRVLKLNRGIPIRLLLLGLPCTIVLGFLVARWVFPQMDVFEAAILATMLAPTDAALGSAVIDNPRVPAPLREALNVESGLNDGICVPVLLVLLALADGGSANVAPRVLAEELGIGLGFGVAMSGLGVLIANACSKRGWLDPGWSWASLVALALACFSGAQLLGGSGFIACFSGGILFDATAKPHSRQLIKPARGLGNVLSMVTWVVFGAAVMGVGLDHFDWRIAVYSLLSLTVIRMLPSYLCLLGSSVDHLGRLFIGWFGPRGLASIVFVMIVLNKDLPGEDTQSLTVVATITLSILAHGFSAHPLAAAIAKHASGKPRAKEKLQQDPG